MMRNQKKLRFGIWFFLVLLTVLLVPSIIGHGQEPTKLTVDEVLQEAQNDGIEVSESDLRKYFPSGEITADGIHLILTSTSDAFQQESECYGFCLTYLRKLDNINLEIENFYLSAINIPNEQEAIGSFRYGGTCKLSPNISFEDLTSKKDWYPILALDACVPAYYGYNANSSVKALLYAWGKLIEKKNQGVSIINRITFLDSARKTNPPTPFQTTATPVQRGSTHGNLPPNGATIWEQYYQSQSSIAPADAIMATIQALQIEMEVADRMTQTATWAVDITNTAEAQTAMDLAANQEAVEAQNTETAAALATATAQTATAIAATEETQVAGTATATAATAIEAARLVTEVAETQIAAAATATATEEARLAKVRELRERRVRTILIVLGVIGLGGAALLFALSQRKRKAAYRARFEQRRINTVPAPHLFDVEPKARPASAIPGGVSAGGVSALERSVTLIPEEEIRDGSTMEIDLGASTVLRYDFGNMQHQGSREYQEDSFGFSDIADPNLVATRGILAVIADGMGGLKNGKSISERTVMKFRRSFVNFTPGIEVPRQLFSLVLETNNEIYETDKQKGGTTLICVYIYENSMYWVSVGDSAIYLFRQGRIYQLNREHNRLNDLYLRFMYREITKAQLLAEPTLQGLTSNIGRKELREVDQNLRELRLRRGDRILLCSDGVSGRLTEKEMLVAMSQGHPQKCADALKNFVLKKKAPKQDNLTAQVISCD